MLEKIIQDKTMTHMPFLMRDADGRSVLFYCNSTEPGMWKLHVLVEGSEPRRLQTGFSSQTIECSPTAWQDETGWHVSFIAGNGDVGPRYRLYRMDGASLDQFTKPVAIRMTKTGFIFKDRLVHGEPNDLVHIIDHVGDRDVELPGARLYRIAYRADEPSHLLISGEWLRDNDLFTLEYDLNTGRQYFIECDGQPAYKCTILDDIVMYAHRYGKGFEDRVIRQASVTLKQTAKCALWRFANQPTGASLRQVACKCNPNALGAKLEPTRESCIECVEKHIGAAYVLLGETHDGYAYRLRAIGHLHEAEDESQRWLALHIALRNARRQYQQQGTMPDWQKFEKLIDKARNAK
ncbi:MAG: hypothetical protein GWP14_04540 [Actinobacteria bacterium]|nr:hypothetical protein [Actinomycetota bacterium]